MGEGQAQVPFPGIPTALSATFIVADELTVKAILGLDFLETYRCVINGGSRTIEFPPQGVSLLFSGPQVGKSFGKTPSVNLILKQRLAVPGGSEMEVMAEVSITISTIHGL